jgi:sugar O-acyltransferase (sialic acid O-acetyltransferase NeuD family)
MSKPEIILIGAGGHARSCIDVIEQNGKYRIAGLVGLAEQKFTQQLGYDVIATDDELTELAKSYQYALITVGQVKTANHRMGLYQMSLECGFKMPSIISPISHVSQNATIGEGSIVMHGAIINAGAQVGINCIINTRAVIEHDTSVGDHSHISTGAILNGGVSVGSGCFIGSGCVMKEGISTGQDCVVGMGLSVRHNLANSVIFTGNGKS